MPDEIQLELLAPWYTQNTSESRTLELFDAIPVGLRRRARTKQAAALSAGYDFDQLYR